MTREQMLQEIERGDYIVVRYGRNGEQLMLVNRISAIRGLQVGGWLWRKNSRRWTKRQTAREASAVLRRASPEDVRRFKPTPCLGQPFSGR